VNKQHGYTLIELAIVTIIVGLLLGGVMRGQEMVVQAKTKSLLSDFTGVTAAVQAYRDRYRALPGDDSGGAGRWGAYGTRSGNGNGAVEGLYNDQPPPGDPAAAGALSEADLFWWHMRVSGFVSGPLQGQGAANPPENSVGGIIGVQTDQGPAGFLPGLFACASNVPDRNAIAVDAQLDDLEPAQGQVRSVLEAAGASSPRLTDPGNSQPTAYVEAGNRYVVCRGL